MAARTCGHAGRICLWGGLPLETLQFGTSHSVAVGTPYDNFMAMIDEFESLRDTAVVTGQ